LVLRSGAGSGPFGFGWNFSVPSITRRTPVKQPAKEVVKEIRRVERRHFSAEENFRVVLEGLRGVDLRQN
jgi:hypothetical protein